MMIEMAEEIASSLNLVGSNGIDFLITDNGPIVVEVNPRFQGSLDTVEAATGLNLFHAHVESFFNGIEALRGRLGSLGKGELCHSARNAEIRKARMAAGRGVLYAERQMTVKGDLRSDIKEICDVPSPGYRPAIGQPVTSINALGSDRAAVMDRLAYLASKLQGLVSP
jgi:predicted ATP-grasp superfamily ATP-dependent carboligase